MYHPAIQSFGMEVHFMHNVGNSAKLALALQHENITKKNFATLKILLIGCVAVDFHVLSITTSMYLIDRLCCSRLPCA